MNRRRKKGAVAGLTTDNVVKARAQAFNRISKRAAESQERAKSDRLFREKPLYERIPSLTAYDAIIREPTKQCSNEDVKETHDDFSKESKGRGKLMKKRKVHVIQAVADKTRKFTDAFATRIDVPLSTKDSRDIITRRDLPTTRNARRAIPRIPASDKGAAKGKTRPREVETRKKFILPSLDPGLLKRGKKATRPITPSDDEWAKGNEDKLCHLDKPSTCELPNKSTAGSKLDQILPAVMLHTNGSDSGKLSVNAVGGMSRKSASSLLGDLVNKRVRSKSILGLSDVTEDLCKSQGVKLPSIRRKSTLTIAGDNAMLDASKSRLQPQMPVTRQRSRNILGTTGLDMSPRGGKSNVSLLVTPATEKSIPSNTAALLPKTTPVNQVGSSIKVDVDKLQPTNIHRGIARFRRVVNVVRFCLRLFPHLISPIPINYSTEIQKNTIYKDSTGRTLTFDVNYFKKQNKIFCGLSEAARRALAKTSEDRTELDLTILQDVLQKWSCLEEYSDAVKRELARLLHFFNAEPHRVILKEGQIGNYIYFIVSGGVRLHYTVVDNKTGSRGILPGRELKPGEFFGEQDIFYHTNRTQTAVSSRDSELLYLRKSDLTAAVKAVEERARANRLQAMENFPCFSDWDEQELINVADTSALNTYTDNQVILGKTSGPPKQLYFLNRGRCQVVRELDSSNQKNTHLESIVKSSPKSAMPNGRRNKKREKNRKRRFITVGELKTGNYFGVGENMSENYVLSKGNTECLVVDAANFEKRGRKKDLLKMKETRETHMPKPKQMLDQYLIRKRWAKFKEQLIGDIKMKRKIPNCTRLSDVPQVLRLDPRP